MGEISGLTYKVSQGEAPSPFQEESSQQAAPAQSSPTSPPQSSEALQQLPEYDGPPPTQSCLLDPLGNSPTPRKNRKSNRSGYNRQRQQRSGRPLSRSEQRNLPGSLEAQKELNEGLREQITQLNKRLSRQEGQYYQDRHFWQQQLNFEVKEKLSYREAYFSQQKYTQGQQKLGDTSAQTNIHLREHYLKQLKVINEREQEFHRLEDCLYGKLVEAQQAYKQAHAAARLAIAQLTDLKSLYHTETGTWPELGTSEEYIEACLEADREERLLNRGRGFPLSAGDLKI